MDSLTNMFSQGDALIPTILVIEDDLDHLLLFKYTLNMFNYKVLTTNKAKIGLYLAKKYRPDLILLDIILKDMSGLQVASLLKSDRETKNIPLIAVTALVRNKEQNLIFSSGCDACICKPYFLEELHSLIEFHLNLNKICN